MPQPERTAYQWHSGKGQKAQDFGGRRLFRAHRHGGVYPLQLPDEESFLPSDAPGSEYNFGWIARTGSPWNQHPGLPLGTILGRRAGCPIAHDLSVLEGEVPRRICCRQSPALARTGKKAASARPSQPPAMRARAAAAGVQLAPANSDVPEFEVKSAAEGHEESADTYQQPEEDDKV